MVLILILSSAFFLSYGCSRSIALDATAPAANTVSAGQSPQAGTSSGPLSVTWNKTCGITGQDEAYAVIRVSDGYVMAGYANRQLYLVKTDLNGNKVWYQLYGGPGLMKARSIVAVSDGYVVAGFTSPTINNGPYSVYLMKTDLNGNKIWDRTYQKTVNGTPVDSLGESVIAVDDGYVIVGEAHADIYGNDDVYLIKTDTNGNLVWDRSYGGIDTDRGNSIVKAGDGYVIAGYTQVSHDSGRGYDFSGGDILLMKTDLRGNLLWNRSIGGLYQENEYALIAVDDGYVITGDSNTGNNGSATNFDVYLVKTDLDGRLVWNKTYGGPENDEGRAVIPVQYGYIVAGYTISHNGRESDIYLMKADRDGNMVWNKTYAGTGLDEANAMALADDGYVIAGFSYANGINSADTYLLKVAPEATPTPTPEPTSAPGPALPPVPPGMPAIPPSAAGPAIAPSSAVEGLPTVEIAVICVIIVLVIAILVMVAVAGYVLLKK